jgi:hypothetical protein
VKIALPLREGHKTSFFNVKKDIFLLRGEMSMKTVGYLFMLVITVATLSACDSGKGPSKPTSATSSQSLK